MEWHLRLLTAETRRAQRTPRQSSGQATRRGERQRREHVQRQCGIPVCLCPHDSTGGTRSRVVGRPVRTVGRREMTRKRASAMKRRDCRAAYRPLAMTPGRKPPGDGAGACRTADASPVFRRKANLAVLPVRKLEGLFAAEAEDGRSSCSLRSPPLWAKRPDYRAAPRW